MGFPLYEDATAGTPTGRSSSHSTVPHRAIAPINSDLHWRLIQHVNGRFFAQRSPMSLVQHEQTNFPQSL
ncbi:MAG: hypothetical protein GDA48_03760 [Hormoscilla sp. GM102CHS1]|nr:hypothetical protein [Hormoscilla sp. GM102CHS1]